MILRSRISTGASSGKRPSSMTGSHRPELGAVRRRVLEVHCRFDVCVERRAEVLMSEHPLDLGRIGLRLPGESRSRLATVSYTHLRAHETRHDIVCRLL